MQPSSRQYGEKGESEAVRFLTKNGYRILQQNYRTKLGEIDIIAKDGGVIVFVEVKARRSKRYGHPKWAITPKKQRNMSMVALHYLKSTHQMQSRARFDVLTIQSDERPPQIEIVRNAFDLAFGK
ncbi:MAG: YraN family protein [Desulfobacteraceae bacterium]|nr:MAG: YraN family protein [Desulfobacteraceae bacterium]